MNKNFFRMLMLSCITFLSLALYSCKGVSDSDIQKNVSEKLAGMPGVMADVKDGVVILSGVCSDEASKANCETQAKSVKGVKSVINNCTVTPPPTASAPVTISPDDALTTGVNDAIKDFAGVTATVTDGVVTLTGSLKRSRLQNLMQALNTLKPKKINNQLTLQ